MRLLAAVVALASLAFVANANAQDGFRATPGNAIFPDRTYALTLDEPRPLQTEDVTVTENGIPVRNAVCNRAAAAEWGLSY